MWKQENREQFLDCIRDLIDTPSVQAMGSMVQHVNISCLDHCIFVSYMSFLICRRFHLDYEAAARGGLLHDLFLYDWHEKNSHEGLHAFAHPRVALKNAQDLCPLSDKEQDIIVKHMWPLSRHMPKFRESYVVSFADKLCALTEMSFVYHLMRVNKRLMRTAAQ